MRPGRRPRHSWMKGEGVTKDDVEAVKWYRKAAEQGNALAQANLGILFETGRGVPKDDVEAAVWYRKAAEQGNTFAQANLRVLLESGRKAPASDSLVGAQQIVAPSLQASPSAFVSGLSMTVPEGWEKRSLMESMIVGRGVVYAVNRTIGAGLLLSSSERKGIANLHEFAKSRRAIQSDQLGEAQSSEITQLQINGRTAFRFEVVGTLKSGGKMTYMLTIIEGKDEIALLNMWASPTNLEQNRSLFEQHASMVTGL